MSLEFPHRHIGPDAHEQATMLAALGYPDLDSFTAEVVPEVIRWHHGLDLPAGLTEPETIAALESIAGRNTMVTSMIGLGYQGTHTPAVITRNILENPGWYTAYTPYQPEISQGRLEALLNFQTLIEDLTGLPVAGSSLLDEPTAAAEAMTLALRQVRGADTVIVDSDTHPQTLAVLATRAAPLGITLVVADLADGLAGVAPDAAVGAVLISNPGTSGRVLDAAPWIAEAHDRGALAVVIADLLSLTLMVPPGEQGADVVVGSAQRFGVPMGFGGPHAGFMAVRSGLERSLPGRLVGVSVDADGQPAYRLALQTREQHIRREKATSNICAAQVLLAVIASMYAVYHGPDGLRRIASRVSERARTLATGIAQLGGELHTDQLFDTVRWSVPGRADDIVSAALDEGINLRRVDADTVSATVDETTTPQHVEGVWRALAGVLADAQAPSYGEVAASSSIGIPTELEREIGRAHV